MLERDLATEEDAKKTSLLIDRNFKEYEKTDKEDQEYQEGDE